MDADHVPDPSLDLHSAPVMGRLSAALSSRYVVEREIGRGGMATVFLARDLRHESLVAIKVLHPDLTPLVANERFAREIRITAGLQHPGVLPVLDSGDADGVPYYTMPYVEGESLDKRLERERQLPIAEAMKIAREVASALAYAHAKGFIHRDVKPANILLSHGHAIVADFGIARAIDAAGGDQITESGLAVGTAMYMSPEQGAAGTVLDGRSDIYAVGCVLYEMLAGTPPFVGPTPQSVMARHAIDPPPSLRTVRNTVGPEIEAVVVKALAKVPADRFANAAEFADALDEAEGLQAARGTSPAATAATAVKRVRARARANLAVTVIAFAMLASAGFFAWQSFGSSGSLDRHRITVFPLSVSRDFKGSSSIGEDIATVIGHSLDGTGSLRWIDGWRLLPASSNPTSTDARIDPGVARRLARGQRSGFYLSGRVVGHGDSVEVLVDLIDVAGDSIVRQGRATGIMADAWRTGLRSVNTILPALVPGATAHDLTTEWTDRAPEAVAHFLLGEASFRRARASEALAHYREAVRLDSTFALAAVRGAQAATWDHRSSEAESLIRRALAQKMSPQFTHFALGYAAYLEGRPDSATTELRKALAIDPEMAAAWMQLGETYTHLLPVAGRADTLADAAFNEAMRLDSTAVHMLFHPIESRLRRGLAAQASPLLRRFLAADPDSLLAAQLRLMQDCVAKGSRSIPWKSEISVHPFAVLFAAQSLAAGGGQPDCAESAYIALRTFETPEMAATNAVLDNRRWASLVGLTGILVAEGRTDEAIAHVDSAIARKEGGISLYLVGAAVAPALAARAADAAHLTTSQSGASCERCTVDRAWQMGAWAAAAGDSVALRGFSENLASRASSVSPMSVLLARATTAKLAVMRRDSLGARKELKAVLESPAANTAGNLLWLESSGRGPERLAYARLLAAKRDFRGALDVADVFDSPASQSFVLYLPASLALRASIADSANMSMLGTVYRQRLAALKTHATQRE